MTQGRFARRGPEARTPDLVEHAVARAKEGDTHAFHFLYVRFVDEVCTFARGFARDSYQAEEISDAVFARLVTEIRRYEPGDVPFAVWLLRYAVWVARDELRAGRDAAPDENDAREDDDGALEPSWHLREALRCLPDEQRQVLVLREIGRLSPEKVAERLGKTEASVRSLDADGRRALRAADAAAVSTPKGT
jgi:RNA polymerase sigma-70 factor (ECF subfamily)